MKVCEGHNVKRTTGNSLAAIVQKSLHIKHSPSFFPHQPSVRALTAISLY